MSRHRFIAFSALAAGLPALASAQPIAADDPRLIDFATTVADFSPAPGGTDPDRVDEALNIPDAGFGGVPANGLVSLGDAAPGTAPGSITLGFNNAITNGAGADFAVFENAGDFGAFGLFAELAFVEVSTDGSTFARFVSRSDSTLPDEDPNTPPLSTDLLADFGQAFATLPNRGVVAGLAGADEPFFGTLFDLELLTSAAEVLSGGVDLSEINFVRLVDIPGDGRFADSNGNPIFDAFDGGGGAVNGFDLDAVGVINAVPEPTAAALLSLGGIALLRRRRTS